MPTPKMTPKSHQRLAKTPLCTAKWDLRQMLPRTKIPGLFAPLGLFLASAA